MAACRKEHTKYTHILHVVATGRDVNAFLADTLLVTQPALRPEVPSLKQDI